MGGLFSGRSQAAKTDPRQEARLAEQEEQAEADRIKAGKQAQARINARRIGSRSGRGQLMGGDLTGREISQIALQSTLGRNPRSGR